MARPNAFAALTALSFLILAATATGCLAVPKSTDYGKHVCKPGERNAACAEDYKPVCATIVQGKTADSSKMLSYFNKCLACSDAKVESWVAGICMDELQGFSQCNRTGCYKGMNICRSAGNCSFHATEKA